MAKLMQARVLVDIAHLGLLVGHIAEGSAACIGDLHKAGAVDPHKEAVAYAQKTKAPVVRVRTPSEQEELAAAQAAVAAAEKALAEETDDKKKPDLAKALKPAQDALADLS
jgi:hypothetical protein